MMRRAALLAACGLLVATTGCDARPAARVIARVGSEVASPAVAGGPATSSPADAAAPTAAPGAAYDPARDPAMYTGPASRFTLRFIETQARAAQADAPTPAWTALVRERFAPTLRSEPFLSADALWRATSLRGRGTSVELSDGGAEVKVTIAFAMRGYELPAAEPGGSPELVAAPGEKRLVYRWSGPSPEQLRLVSVVDAATGERFTAPVVVSR
jgi:hypothetical protein